MWRARRFLSRHDLTCCSAFAPACVKHTSLGGISLLIDIPIPGGRQTVHSFSVSQERFFRDFSGILFAQLESRPRDGAKEPSSAFPGTFSAIFVLLSHVTPNARRACLKAFEASLRCMVIMA